MRALLLALSCALVAQQLPPRDQPARVLEFLGTASIAGRVVSAATGAPLQGATVSIVPASPGDTPTLPAVRNDGTRTAALTDAFGRFQIGSLAAGNYRVVALPPSSAARYLPAGYQSRRGNDPGRAIAVAEGSTVRNIDIALPLGLAIEGRVVDEAGEPLSRMMVFVALVMPGSDSPQRAQHAPSTTDDLGRYRIYGLEPGEYLVGVEGGSFVTTSPLAWSGAGTVSGTLTDRQPNTFVMTFHPGTTSDLTAQRVRVAAPNDTVGIDISVARTRRLTLSGMVLDSQGSPARSTNGVAMRRSLGLTGAWPFRTDDGGRFTLSGIDPGEYRLLVGGGLAPGLISVNGRTEFAEMPMTVNTDIEGIVIATQPGIGLAGQVVFAEGAPARPPTMKITFRRPDQSYSRTGNQIPAMLDDDLRFYGSDIFGPLFVRASELPAGWAVKAVTLAGTDITDTPTVFKKEHDGQLHIVLTSKPATVEGQVQGDPVPGPGEATIYVFSEDRTSWSLSSPRTRFSDVKENGRFTVSGLTAGRYYAIAISRDGFRIPDGAGTTFFELLSREATAFSVEEDERKTLPLRLWHWPE